MREVPAEPAEGSNEDVKTCTSRHMNSGFCEWVRNAWTPPDETPGPSRNISALKNIRTLKAKGSKMREPLGVVVSVDFELGGLRGRPVKISATTNHDTGAADFWIPLPKSGAPFFIKARLTAGKQIRTMRDSRAFK